MNKISNKNRISKHNFTKIIVILIIFSALLFAFKLFTPINTGEFTSPEEYTEYLDQRIPFLMKDYDIPGVNIALIRKGKTVWSKSYGYADIEEGRKMTTDTYCRVQSISKSVTAWGVMKLVEQGKIGLDEPVEMYLANWKLPDSEFSEGKITVRQLLSHSAGLPLGTVGVHYSPDEDIPSLEASLSKRAVLKQEPGLLFSYSNTGFNLLELLIEEVTGREFAEYMEQEVLIPLGMSNSSFTWSEGLKPEVPVGYDLKGNSVPVYVYPEKASGGLFATVEDIATFAAAGMTKYTLTGQEILTAQSINELYKPVVGLNGYYSFVSDSYGFGHFIESLSNGYKAVWHGGQGHGWMTHFHSVPETGDGIVILTNSQRSWPLIAYILNDWAQWSGFTSVGMGKITTGIKLLWVIVGLFLLIFAWQVFRLGQGFISGSRQFAPLFRRSRNLWLVQCIISIVLLIILLWSLTRDYLFIFSVFPVASIWLMFSISLLALILLLSAIFPMVEE